jgi:hypothetical protein
MKKDSAVESKFLKNLKNHFSVFSTILSLKNSVIQES